MRPVRFDPENDELFSIDQMIPHDSKKRYDEYYAHFNDSPGDRCPHEVVGGPKHNTTRRKDVTLPPRYDYVGNRPARVNLTVHEWWCRQCRFAYLQDDRPYVGKSKTSIYFDEYVAARLIGSPQLDTDYFTESFDLSRTGVYEILLEFQARLKKIPFDALECEEVRLYDIKWGAGTRIVVFGKPTPDARKIMGSCLEGHEYVLMGFSHAATFKTVFEECKSLSTEPRSLSMYVPLVMRKAFDSTKFPQVRSIKVTPKDKIPHEIAKVMNALVRMKKQGITFPVAKLRVMLFDPFRVFRINEARISDWWVNTRPEKKPTDRFMKAAFATEDLCACRCMTYNAISPICNEELRSKEYETVNNPESFLCPEGSELACYYWSSIAGFMKLYGENWDYNTETFYEKI